MEYNLEKFIPRHRNIKEDISIGNGGNWYLNINFLNKEKISSLRYDVMWSKDDRIVGFEFKDSGNYSLTKQKKSDSMLVIGMYPTSALKEIGIKNFSGLHNLEKQGSIYFIKFGLDD